MEGSKFFEQGREPVAPPGAEATFLDTAGSEAEAGSLRVIDLVNQEFPIFLQQFREHDYTKLEDFEKIVDELHRLLKQPEVRMDLGRLENFLNDLGVSLDTLLAQIEADSAAKSSNDNAGSRRIKEKTLDLLRDILFERWQQ